MSKLASSLRHGAPCTMSRTHVHPNAVTPCQPLPAKSAATLHIDRSIVFRCLSFTQEPIDALVGSTSVEKWGSGSERGTREVTPNRFGRCTSRERLRQHRLLPPLCVLQLSPSAYPSCDNCRRHGDALLIGWHKDHSLGQQIDPRIADGRAHAGRCPSIGDSNLKTRLACGALCLLFSPLPFHTRSTRCSWRWWHITLEPCHAGAP
jgi:hypothetical protein